MKKLATVILIGVFVVAFIASSVSAEAGPPPPKKPIDFTSSDSVTFTIYCPYQDKIVKVTLIPRIPSGTYFDPAEFQGYESVVPFANPSIKVDIWMTHSGWSETAENPSDVIRQCLQGGSDSTNWALFDESTTWSYIDLLAKQTVEIKQGDNVTIMDIKAITIVDHEYMEEYSKDIRGILGILAEIDPRFESLLVFNPIAQPVTDYFLVTCLWGPFGESWYNYSRVHEYYSYARLVLWLTPHIESMEGTLPSQAG